MAIILRNYFANIRNQVLLYKNSIFITLKKSKSIFAIIVGVGLVPLITYADNGTSTESSYTLADAIQELTIVIESAKQQCEQSIKKTLKNPDSAEFDREHVEVNPETDPHAIPAWIIKMPVQTKNSSNATLYTIYQCRVNKNKQDHWQTISLDLVN